MIAVGLVLIFCVFSVDSMLKIVSKGVIPSDFSCEGRISGYYADVETGCQTYHYCDGLNRHYSYVCPNGTLFQQRMMVCFHAYTVDCQSSEKDYDANLLIGKEGEPFVKDYGDYGGKISKTKKSTFQPFPPFSQRPPPAASQRPPLAPQRPSFVVPERPAPQRPFIGTQRPPPPAPQLPQRPPPAPQPSPPVPSLPQLPPLPPPQLPSTPEPFPPLPHPRPSSNFFQSPSVELLPPLENSRQSKSSKASDSVIKIILNDTRNLYFISNQNSSTGEDLKTVQEFFIPVDNQITNFRFKKNPTVENGCPSYCHPKFLIPGTCHPCLMIK